MEGVYSKRSKGGQKLTAAQVLISLLLAVVLRDHSLLSRLLHDGIRVRVCGAWRKGGVKTISQKQPVRHENVRGKQRDCADRFH